MFDLLATALLQFAILFGQPTATNAVGGSGWGHDVNTEVGGSGWGHDANANDEVGGSGWGHDANDEVGGSGWGHD